MALEFLAQALCLGLWYIITGGVTPPRNPNGYGGGARNAQNGYGRINYAQPDDAEEDDDDDDDDNMMNIGAGQIQDGPGGDDEPLLQVDDAHGDNRAPGQSHCATVLWWSLPSNRLIGLVVRRPPREWKIPGSNPDCSGIFSGSSHTSDLKIGTPVATLPGAWRYRVSAGTGRPGVSIL